jgi:brefeldin A-inhibited guanine nucleotide-exchange protein
MWNIVSAHLTSTALHSNAAVAIYAVDSFRQLSMQFLKREELGVFEFQRKFIKPFEGVMLKCKNASVKEFLLKSVEQIIVMYGSDEMASGAIKWDNQNKGFWNIKKRN